MGLYDDWLERTAREFERGLAVRGEEKSPRVRPVASLRRMGPDFFLARLRDLVKLHSQGSGFTEEGLRTLRYAIFSTYLDLRDMGRGQQALAIIRDDGDDGERGAADTEEPGAAGQDEQAEGRGLEEGQEDSRA